MKMKLKLKSNKPVDCKQFSTWWVQWGKKISCEFDSTFHFNLTTLHEWEWIFNFFISFFCHLWKKGKCEKSTWTKMKKKKQTWIMSFTPELSILLAMFTAAPQRSYLLKKVKMITIAKLVVFDCFWLFLVDCSWL